MLAFVNNGCGSRSGQCFCNGRELKNGVLVYGARLGCIAHAVSFEQDRFAIFDDDDRRARHLVFFQCPRNERIQIRGRIVCSRSGARISAHKQDRSE
jgi:hypothetical protein